MKLGKVFIVVLLAVCFSASALAQDVPAANGPASKEDVERFMGVTRANNQTERILAAMKAQVRAQLAQQVDKMKPTATLDEKDAAVAKGMAPLDKIWSDSVVKQMEDDMVPIYQNHFTHAEILQLTAFYSSPVGQKMLSEMPAVLTEFMQAETPRIQKIIEDAAREAEAAAKEEKEKAEQEKK